jgi:flagella basal body P-ring formation protein FlgA
MINKTYSLFLALITALALPAFASAEGLEEDNKAYKLYQISEPIKVRTQDHLGREKITLKWQKFQRIGSKNAYSDKQVNKLKIADKYIIESLDIDQEKQTIEAILAESNGDNKINFSSKYELGIRVPVLSSDLNKGEIINQDHISFENISENKIRSNSLTNITDIIGKVTKRSLRKGKLLSNYDIEDKLLVKRNNVVSARYKVKNLTVESKLIALENGHDGDMVKVQNPSSGKITKGLVIGTNKVRVGVASENDLAIRLEKRNNI